MLVIALLSALGCATSASASDATIPTKIVRIYNNTTIPIYAVLETSKTETDEWLQAEFRVTNIKRDTYSHTKVYRVYINPKQGILPGESAAIRVPFYSQLAKNPRAEKPNQYINWWNGDHIYIYDRRKGLVDNLRADRDDRVTFLTDGITCLNQSTCEPLRIFASNIILPLSDPSTLTEYTFVDARRTARPTHWTPRMTAIISRTSTLFIYRSQWLHWATRRSVTSARWRSCHRFGKSSGSG